MSAPTLHTARLVLRMPVLSDFGPRADFATSDRSIPDGGPVDRATAWRIFAADVGQWALMGYGPFSVCDRLTDAYLGEVGVYHPETNPEPELGWFVVPEAEGKGIAREAALCVMAFARDRLGLRSIVNYIDPSNARSIMLALRLGGSIDPAKGRSPGEVVIRHNLERLA